jgi:hypothetical protein
MPFLTAFGRLSLDQNLLRPRTRIENRQVLDYIFPLPFQAYWIRFTTQDDTIATAQLTYQ